MKNLILITIDCLRQDFLGLSPNFKFETLQKLFNEGISFTNMISAGANTPLAFPSIFSSSYSSMYGGYRYLSKSRITLAEVLKNQGYVTAGIHSNPHLISQYNYDRGFTYYYDYTKTQKGRISKFIATFRRRYKEKYKQSKLIGNIIDSLSENKLIKYLVLRYIYSKRPYDDAKVINSEAIKWLNSIENKKNKFFLWLHYMEPHGPYRVSRETKALFKKINNSIVAKFLLKAEENPKEVTPFGADVLKFLYLNQIKYLDLKLKEFFEFLSKKDLWKDTIIIITSDHGVELFEHRLFGHARGEYKREKDIYLFNTVLKIPFVIYKKGVKPEINDKLVSSIDIAPTICALLGVNSSKEWLGNNILSEKFTRKIAISEQVYFKYRDGEIWGAFSFQSKNEKFIYNTYDRSYHYYRLDKDPKETENLISKYPEKIKEIEKLYFSHIEKILETKEDIPGYPEIDLETEKRLRALGYI
jgi:arylsulfatase A-like enzyme